MSKRTDRTAYKINDDRAGYCFVMIYLIDCHLNVKYYEAWVGT